MDQVEREEQAAAKAGLPVINQPAAGFPFTVDAITTIPHQAQFNPLKYVQGLAAAIAGENCLLFEGTKVINVEDGEPCVVHTQQGTVIARQVVMATHTPKGVYAMHTAMEPYREYALAVRLKGELPAPGVYWHVRQMQHYSVRPYSNEQGNYLLVLGEAHKVGHQEHNEKNFLKLEQYLTKRFAVDHIVYNWAAQNYKPADTLPYIGTSPLQKNTYIATGFAADGLAWGTVSAMINSNAIMGRENPWADFFDPKRFTPVASAPKFLKENIGVAVHLIKDHLFYSQTDQLSELKA